MKVSLPAEICVSDYHEFQAFERNLQQLIPGVKVKELAFNGKYLGMAYVGNLREKKNAEMRKKVEKSGAEFYLSYYTDVLKTQEN
jgi:hypothetical protein